MKKHIILRKRIIKMKKLNNSDEILDHLNFLLI